MGDIPDIPRASPGHFLIASLHFLTEPAVTELKSKVEEANRSRRHPVYAFCGNIARQQAAEAACHAGCINDIFALSTRARQAGWQRLLVIDALSDRQLKGRTRPGEGVDLSVVLIEISCARTSAVTARRMSVRKGLSLLFSIQPVSIIPLRPPRHTPTDSLPEQDHAALFEGGLVLHDPKLPLFGCPAAPAASANMALRAAPHLPHEIQTLILDHLKHQSIDEKTAAPSEVPQKDDNVVHLTSLASIPDSVASTLEKQIAVQAQSEKPFEIHEWTGLASATRNEVFAILERAYQPSRTTLPVKLLLFDPHLWRNERKLVVLQSSIAMPIAVAYTTGAASAVEDMLSKRLHVPNISELENNTPSQAEILRPPSSPFFNDLYFDYYIREHVLFSPPPVFVATSSLSATNIRDITASWGVRDISTDCIVPWQAEEDATLLDMFQFIVDLHKKQPYVPKPPPAHHLRTIICFDKDSVHDRCMSLIKFSWRCDTDLDHKGRWDRWECLGLRSKRLPGDEAMSWFERLSTGHAAFADIRAPVKEAFVPPSITGDAAITYLQEKMGPFLDMDGL